LATHFEELIEIGAEQDQHRVHNHGRYTGWIKTMKMRSEGCMSIWVMKVQIQMDMEKEREKE
jgi:hypothetical protein